MTRARVGKFDVGKFDCHAFWPEWANLIWANLTAMHSVG